MKHVWLGLIMGCGLLGALPADAQRTLYVNGATGSDSVPKSSNSAASPWRTIGRAAWGSANRASPVASEAASAGDTVNIAGGTYTTDVAVNNRFAVVYNPVNSGTANGPITFTCVGDCVLGAPNANGPVIGAVDQKNYIKWFANVSLGHSWQIRAYGPQAGSAGPTEVNTTPDTGPVVGSNATGVWIEGAEVDGGVPMDYGDNWNAIRLENCTSCVVRNNRLRNFLPVGSNSTGVTLYGSANAVIEHNEISNTGAAVYFKDTGFTLPQNNVRVRFNRIDAVDQCIRWSTTGEARNYVYQNLCTNSRFGLFITGGGLSDDWIFNNTFYNLPAAGIYPTALGSGGRFWNNIVIEADRVILLEAAPMVAETVIDFEHNVYHAYRGFYSGTDGSLTLAGFRTRYPTHESGSPASISADPRLVNPGGGDFRLCTGAGMPSSECTMASPAVGWAIDIFDLDADGSTSDTVNAGAHVDNTESIGIAGIVSTRPREPVDLRVIQ